MQKRKDHGASPGQTLPTVWGRSLPGAAGCFGLVQFGTRHPRSRCCRGGTGSSQSLSDPGALPCRGVPTAEGASWGLWCCRGQGQPQWGWVHVAPHQAAAVMLPGGLCCCTPLTVAVLLTHLAPI